METSLKFAAVTTSVLFLVSACGRKGTNALSPAEATAFDQAPPEVKEMWVQASEAVRTNGYVTAYNLCYQLANADLSLDEKQAVAKVSVALNDRFLAAVDKGDPAAQQALNDMRLHPPSRNHAN